MSDSLSGPGRGARRLPESQQLFETALQRIRSFHDRIRKHYDDSDREMPAEVSDFLRGKTNHPPLFFLNEEPIKLEGQGIEGADAVWPSTIAEDQERGVVYLVLYFAIGGRLIHPSTKLAIPETNADEPRGTSPVVIIIPREGPTTWAAYIDLIAAEEIERESNPDLRDRPFMPSIEILQKVLYETNNGLQPTASPFTDPQCEELSRIVGLLEVDVNETLINNELGDQR